MEPNKQTLFSLTEQMVQIEAMLEETGGEITPEIEAAWQETGASLTAKVDGYNALIRKLEYRSNVLALEIKRLQALKKTADNSSDRLRAHIFNVMDTFDIPRIDGSFCKMYTSERSAMEVNEDVLLSKYSKVIEKAEKGLPVWLTLVPKIDKTSLKDTCKADESKMPEGVEFVKKKSLTIK